MDNEDNQRPRRVASKPVTTEASPTAADQGAATSEVGIAGRQGTVIIDEYASFAEPTVRRDADGREHPMVGGSFIRAKDGTLTRVQEG